MILFCSQSFYNKPILVTKAINYIKNMVKNGLKMLVVSVIKLEFSASLLQSSVSEDPSEIIIIC